MKSLCNEMGKCNRFITLTLRICYIIALVYLAFQEFLCITIFNFNIIVFYYLSLRYLMKNWTEMKSRKSVFSEKKKNRYCLVKRANHPISLLFMMLCYYLGNYSTPFLFLQLFNWWKAESQTIS